jgi:outer membrane protein assembly factor BamB
VAKLIGKNKLAFSFATPSFLDKHIVLKQAQYLLSIDKESGVTKKFVRQNPQEEVWEFYEIKNDSTRLLILDHHTLTKVSHDLQEIDWQMNNVGSLLSWQNRTQTKQVEIVNDLLFVSKYLGLENGDHLVAVNYKEGKAIWDTPLSSSVNCQYYINDNAFLGMGNGIFIL